jgi:SpoVK/Ycf46/Vps4 family AAA+-type ATPase
MEDFLTAVKHVKPVVSESELQRFTQWDEEFSAY